MKTSSKLALLYGMFAAANSIPNYALRECEGGCISTLSDEEKAKRKGLCLFEYSDGYSCYALNKKNADKKHNKQKSYK